MNTSTVTTFLRILRRKSIPTSKILVSQEGQSRLFCNLGNGRVCGLGPLNLFTKTIHSKQTRRLYSSLQQADLRSVQLDVGPQILSAKLLPERGNLLVNMSCYQRQETIGSVDKHVEDQEFPYVWLRDNCQCPKCFHAEACSRTLPMLDIDFNCQPTSLKVSEDRQTITLYWPDGHESAFKADWLNDRAFTPRARTLRLINYRGARVLWNAQDFAQINDSSCVSDNSWRFSFEDVMSNDRVLLAWLQYLENWGVAMIVGAEPTNGQLRKLANRVAFVRKTHYGELFSVRAKNEPSNVAYTSEKLQLHTDLPYYEYKPGVNMLQCLVQWEGPGGENHLVDSFAVAELMRKEYPNEYKILSSTLVDWADIGQETEGDDDGLIEQNKTERRAFHSIYRAPVICEDRDGYIIRVNVSQPQRDSHFCVQLSSVLSWYSAFGKFANLLHSPRFCVMYKLKPGEILTFDNLRICHGRGAYGTMKDMKKGIERHVKGAYMDWDEVRSRIRTLKKSLGVKDL